MSTVFPDLGRKFRYAMVRIAEQLTDSNCETIMFLEGIPPQCVEGQSNRPLAVLSRLEAKGRFSPLKPEGLNALLKDISRCDLQDQVTEYTSSREFKLAKETEKKRSKSSKKDKRDPKKCLDERQAELELVRELKVAYDPMSVPKNAFAVTLTHVGLLAQVELVRATIFNTIPSDPDPEVRRERAIQAMQEVEEGVEKVARSLRKALSAAGLKSSNSSCAEDPEDDYDHLPGSLPGTPQGSPAPSPSIRRRQFAVPRSPQIDARQVAMHRQKREEKNNKKPSPIDKTASGPTKPKREESPHPSNRQKMVFPKPAAAGGCDAPGSPLQLQKTIAHACAERRRSRSESDPQQDADSPRMAIRGRSESVPIKTPPQSPQLPIHQHGPYMQAEAETDKSTATASSTDNTGDSGYAELRSWQEYRVNSTQLLALDPHAAAATVGNHPYTSLKTENRAEEAIYDEPVTSNQVPK